MAEENGTYVNRDRRIQRYHQARSQPGMARPAWWIAGEVLAGPGPSADGPGHGRGGLRAAGASAGRCSPGSPTPTSGFTGRVLTSRDGGRPAAVGARHDAGDEGFILLSVIKMLVVFTIIMVGVALLTLMERKVSAWMQNRRGPNRVGWAGLLQPAADGLKNILKEETFPAEANRGLFLLAPALSFIPALLLSAVIPFAAPLPLDFDFTLPLLGRFA